MTSDDSDDVLLARLRALAGRLDGVPDHVTAAARAAIEMRDLDGELAALIADSAADAPELTFEAVRGGLAHGTVERLLSFDGGGVRIELEVDRSGDGLTLIGQLHGVDRGGSALERGDGHREPLDLDELGRFLLAGLAPGPARLRCRSTAGRLVHTSWVSL
jgi:hypothetical protein